MKSSHLRSHFLTLLIVVATPGLSVAGPDQELDIGLLIEPTASHISGYLEVLAARRGAVRWPSRLPTRPCLIMRNDSLVNVFTAMVF